MLLLVSRSSERAAWGLIALLVAAFWANIPLYRHRGLLPLRPPVHLLSLPLLRCAHPPGLRLHAAARPEDRNLGVAR